MKERWTQDINTLSTAVLRLLEEESSKEKTSEVRAIVSPDMSALLLNERRVRLNDISFKRTLLSFRSSADISGDTIALTSLVFSLLDSSSSNLRTAVERVLIS